jgi:hypothetical protein
VNNSIKRGRSGGEPEWPGTGNIRDMPVKNTAGFRNLENTFLFTVTL